MIRTASHADFASRPGAPRTWRRSGVHRAIGAGALLALVLGACARPAERPGEAPQASPQAPPDRPDVAVPDAPRFTEGERLAYTVQLAARSVLDGAQESRYGFDLSADLVLTARQLADETQVHVRLLDATFSQLSGGSAEDFAAVKAEIERPFAFSLRQGKLIGMRLAPGMSSQAAILLRTLAAVFQFPSGDELRDAAAQGRVEVTEHDATGAYRARYGFEGDAVTKSKLRYTSLLSSGTLDSRMRAAVMPVIGDSRYELRLADGHLQRYGGEESVESHLALDKRLSVETTLRVQLASDPLDVPGADWAALEATTSTVAADVAVAQASAADRFDAMRVRDAKFPEVLAALERYYAQGAGRGAPAAGDDETTRQQLAQFSLLVPLLRQQPEHTAELEARIRRGDGLGRLLLDALANAGTAPAEAALIRIVGNGSLDAELRRQAALSLIRSKRPDRNLVTFLEAHLDDPVIADHALLGLGTAARRLQEQGDAETAARISARLVALLEQAAAPQARVRVLRAIANTGHPDALVAVKPDLQSPNSSIRQAAIDAIRLMPGDAVDALLARALEQDPDIKVQKAVLRNLRLRQPTPATLAVVEKIALDSERHTLRHDAIARLSEWLPNHPELAATLTRIAAQEPVQSTGALASSALQRTGRGARDDADEAP